MSSGQDADLARLVGLAGTVLVNVHAVFEVEKRFATTTGTMDRNAAICRESRGRAGSSCHPVVNRFHDRHPPVLAIARRMPERGSPRGAAGNRSRRTAVSPVRRE